MQNNNYNHKNCCFFNSVFVLHHKTFGDFLWFGRGCNGDERELGRLVAKHITKKAGIETVAEGQEPHEFWAALGGKTEYSSGKEFEVFIEFIIETFYTSSELLRTVNTHYNF